MPDDLTATTSGLVDERFLDDLPRRRKTPQWVRREPLVCAGAWEPLSHRRRRGTATVDDDALFAYEHSEAFVRDLLDAGVNLLATSYCKGLYVDEAEYPLKEELAAHCRKHGLRLAVYIRADNVYAECLADELGRRDVLARRADGRVPVYGREEFRPATCFHKPDTMDWFKTDIRRAVEELRVDALHLDGFIVGGMETYDACRCEVCRRDFTAFLTRRYAGDAEACRRRFGHTHLGAIQPPGLIAEPLMPTGHVVDPVWQEWIVFRCTWSARVAREIAEYVHDLNPEVAILINNAVAVRENTALLLGADLPSLGRCVDMFMNEDGYGPQITADGRLIQRVRQHKLGLATDVFLWNYMNRSTDAEARLAMAETVALNRGRITHVGYAEGQFPDDTIHKHGAIKKRMLGWLQEHWKHFQDLVPVADVAVWREPRAMAFAAPLTYATTMQLEQLLIEDRVPFSIAGRDWAPDTRVIVLPGLHCLDDEACRQAIAFVEQGGGALIVGDTSLRDGWGRLRREFGLESLLPPTAHVPGLHAEPHVLAAGPDVMEAPAAMASNDDILVHPIGRGHVAYTSSIVDPATQPDPFNPDHTYDVGLDTTNWRVPEQAEALRATLARLLNNRQTMGVEAPRGVIAEYYHRPADGTYYAHIVNLTDNPVHRVVARLDPPEGTRATGVRVLSPDEHSDPAVECSPSETRLTAVLGRLSRYAMVVFETERVSEYRER